MSRLLPLAVALAALLPACNDEPPAPGLPCETGATACFDDPEYLLTCSAAGTWASTRCPDSHVCHQGVCQVMACSPGSKTCRAGGVITCRADGTGYGEPEACGADQACERGRCRERVCTPGQTRCQGGTSAIDTEQCDALGVRWDPGPPCPKETGCLHGTCLPASCEPNQKECGPSTLFTCDATGRWRDAACPAGQPCLFDRCVACVDARSCAADEVCSDGACVATSPAVVTAELPPATIGRAYSATLEAKGGLPPYAWQISQGKLPAGLSLTADGTVSGTPTAPGTEPFTARVADQKNRSGQRDLSLEVLPEGPLRVTTTTLPDGEMGLDYAALLAATGGQAPYAWQVLKGPLPKGVSLSSGGALSGVPDAVGTFPLTVRVFDAITPPGYATKDLGLTIKIAPLTIEGDQKFNLLFTKIIVLPTLIQAIPYSTNLEAKGGLRPYAWSEQAAPTGLGWLIPKWGLPKGLTLDAKGRISGWVTDLSDAIQVKVPFGPTLTGYFVYIRVTDAQKPGVTAEAVFCLPTVPLT